MTKLEPTRTSSDLTATERLRSMLDERGVEHYDHYDVTEWVADDGEICHTSEINSNGASVMVLRKCTTPEQAIAATLGATDANPTQAESSGTCHADETETWQGVCMSKPIRYVRNLTIHIMECSECGRTYEHVNGDYEFCPRCGRKVVYE